MYLLFIIPHYHNSLKRFICLILTIMRMTEWIKYGVFGEFISYPIPSESLINFHIMHMKKPENDDTFMIVIK